jgi:hypothetical protein
MLALPVYAVSHPCEQKARRQAEQLLLLHLGAGERDTAREQITIENHVRLLPSIKNPARSKQRLEVLEVWGYKGKGEFRIKMIYMKGDNKECLPVGQEIINWASY